MGIQYTSAGLVMVRAAWVQGKTCIRHTYVVLRMRRLIWHLRDVSAIHIRRNCVHSHSKLLVV